MAYSAELQKLLDSFRPPFTRSAKLLYPFDTALFANVGITVQVPANESAVAIGNGRVVRVVTEAPTYYTTSISTSVVSVTLDHGYGVISKVSGLASANVRENQNVGRGALLGPVQSNQMSLAIRINGSSVNPVAINPTFKLVNGTEVVGQTGKIRFAPDVNARDTSLGSAATLTGGKRYFSGSNTIRVNVNVNGENPVKTGQAYVGVSASDYWNIYDPLDFTSSPTPCVTASATTYGTVYSAQPWLTLKDYQKLASPIRLQRVTPLVSTAGFLDAFDPMLQTYAGGPSVSNTFNFRNVPAGNYVLYVYGYATSAGTTNVYAAANSDTPVLKTLTHGAVLNTFSEYGNFVKYPLTVGGSGKISLSTYGYLSGIQLVSS